MSARISRKPWLLLLTLLTLFMITVAYLPSIDFSKEMLSYTMSLPVSYWIGVLTTVMSAFSAILELDILQIARWYQLFEMRN